MWAGKVAFPPLKGRFDFRSSNRAYKKGGGGAGGDPESASRGERGMLGEKVSPWERPGAWRKLEVKRDAGGRAGVRRGSRSSMCGGKVQGCAAALLGKPLNQHYTWHSQLAFVVLFPSSYFFKRGKEQSVSFF